MVDLQRLMIVVLVQIRQNQPSAGTNVQHFVGEHERLLGRRQYHHRRLLFRPSDDDIAAKFGIPVSRAQIKTVLDPDGRNRFSPALSGMQQRTRAGLDENRPLGAINFRNIDVKDMIGTDVNLVHIAFECQRAHRHPVRGNLRRILLRRIQIVAYDVLEGQHLAAAIDVHAVEIPVMDRQDFFILQ